MKSYWIESVEQKKKSFPKLENNEEADVCIIGGGLTGLSIAYYLSKTKRKVILLEKESICEHTTGNSTAKITSQHGLFYNYLIRSLGIEKAKQYLEANEQAIKNIEKIIEEEQIECEFERKDAYVFTKQEAELEKIKTEVEAVKSLEFPAEYVENVNLPIETLGAEKFPNQAQFNPCKYALGLVNAIMRNSKDENLNNAENEAKEENKEIENEENNKQNEIGENNRTKIFEHTKVIDLKAEGENYEIIAENNKRVTAKYVVIATHYPIINIPGYYFLKMYQSISYVVGAEINEENYNSIDSKKIDGKVNEKIDEKIVKKIGVKIDGMYITSEMPTISIRTTKMDNGKTLLIVAGMDHKTGEKMVYKLKNDNSDNYSKIKEEKIKKDELDSNKSELNPYEILGKIAKQIDEKCEIKYRWCTEDCISLDKIPYIGEFSNLMPNVYLGTGYKKWGMTSSNVAANIIVDKIMGKENPYEDVFTSTRLKPIKNYQEMGNMIKEVVNSLVIEKLKVPKTSLKSLKENEGEIIEVEGKKIGVYKSEKGEYFGIKPVCTHLGCELTWNNVEKTWDCPCHGSRFSYEGKSIYDPSIKNLETIDIQVY